MHEADYKKGGNLIYSSLWDLLQMELGFFFGYTIENYNTSLNNWNNADTDDITEHKNFSEITTQFASLLKKAESFFLKQSLKKTFINNDIWSDNIFIKMEGGNIEILLIDYEWSMVSSRIIDLSRIYSRGFQIRDRNKPYVMVPEEEMWSQFLAGYGEYDKKIEYSSSFIQAITYNSIRTINYYYKILTERDIGNLLKSNYFLSMKRILSALVNYLHQQI